MIFANDEPHQKATCFAKSLHINGEFHPFIITKTDILRGQELTWDYGNGKEYPWRSVSFCKNLVCSLKTRLNTLLFSCSSHQKFQALMLQSHKQNQ